MSDDSQQPIVVKRIKKGGAGAHGGAWKIAYADFVTAMMAFFLLMWLLGSTAQGDLEGIADFFNTPLKVALAGGSGSGDSSSIIKGGGEDLSRTVGQVKRGDVDSKSAISVDATKVDKPPAAEGDQKSAAAAAAADDARKAQEKAERARLIDLKGQIEALIEASPTLRLFKDQLLMEVTNEGLRIQIVDEKNRPMFDQSSAELKPYTRELLQTIGATLNGVPNRISLTGHTDSTRYAGGERGFSNWELSSNRANASRREMVTGGLDPSKILRVVGLSDTEPFVPEDPAAAQNRRIAIVVLSRQGEAAARGGQRMDLRGDQPVAEQGVEQRINAMPSSTPAIQAKPGAAMETGREVRRSFRERYDAIGRE